MRTALIQMSASMDRDENLDRTETMLNDAAVRGAEVACLQECFSTWFFPQKIEPKDQDWAEPLDGPSVTRMRKVAKALGMILIVPFYERAMHGELYNSVVVVDENGEMLGVYRKHHIPMSSHFNEKFYFKPGNKGFPVFPTSKGKIGIMICYDRHFPECARILGLNGAEVVFVPTATTMRGFSKSVWEPELRGHAIANGIFVAGVNRVGTELESTYYGRSVFIDPIGEVVAQAAEGEEEVLVADLDMARLEEVRKIWPFYRDRRPEAYGRIVEP